MEELLKNCKELCIEFVPYKNEIYQRLSFYPYKDHWIFGLYHSNAPSYDAWIETRYEQFRATTSALLKILKEACLIERNGDKIKCKVARFPYHFVYDDELYNKITKLQEKVKPLELIWLSHADKHFVFFADALNELKEAANLYDFLYYRLIYSDRIDAFSKSIDEALSRTKNDEIDALAKAIAEIMIKGALGYNEFDGWKLQSYRGQAFIVPPFNAFLIKSGKLSRKLVAERLSISFGEDFSLYFPKIFHDAMKKIFHCIIKEIKL